MKIAFDRISIVLLLLISLGSYGPAFAAPSISGANGTVSHGQSILISGSGFGSKPSPNPQLFDKCEGTWTGLSNGSAIPTGRSPWTGDSNSHYNTVSGDQRSIRSTACYYSSASAYNFVDGYLFSSVPSKIYISWWFRVSATTPTNSEKFLRLGEGGQGDTHLVNYTASWAAQSNYLFVNGSYCKPTPGGTSENWSSTILTGGVWHFMECYWDVTNKTWEYRVDGKAITGVVSYTCGFNVNYIWKVGLDTDIGYYPNSWMDDIYVDNTFQHVIIGNASTYSTCTQFEVQPATAWSSDGNSITVTVNQGAFSDGQTAYLYVVDGNGNVNTTGYPITFGKGGGDKTAPAAPVGVKVIVQ
jgi:hypothetical protein